MRVECGRGFGLLQPAAAFGSTACCGELFARITGTNSGVWQQAARTKAAAGCRSPSREILVQHEFDGIASRPGIHSDPNRASECSDAVIRLGTVVINKNSAETKVPK